VPLTSEMAAVLFSRYAANWVRWSAAGLEGAYTPWAVSAAAGVGGVGGGLRWGLRRGQARTGGAGRVGLAMRGGPGRSACRRLPAWHAAGHDGVQLTASTVAQQGAHTCREARHHHRGHPAQQETQEQQPVEALAPFQETCEVGAQDGLSASRQACSTRVFFFIYLC
jgi:hypothetical protein